MITRPKTLAAIREEFPALSKPGDWSLINIEPRMAWPISPQSFSFEDHEIWIIPITEDAYPGLAVRNPCVGREDAYAMLYRALSVISWMKDAGANVVSKGGGSPLFPSYGSEDRRAMILPDPFDLTDFPELQCENAKLALALLREGRGLRHPAYSFVSFYRVIERAIPQGKERGPWMTDAITRLSSHRAKEALASLREHFDGDVGKHLRESGRGAAVHAVKEPIANPDNPADYLRLSNELPIIEELAVLAVSDHFGLQTSHQIWSDHLYELRGWKAIFGKELVDSILRGDEISPNQTVDLPEINARFRLSDPFGPFERMQPIGWSVHAGKGEVQYRSRDGYVQMNLLLDFRDERLVLNHRYGLQWHDDGSAEAAQTGRILAEFNQAHLLNGELQIWESESRSLIAKCDAFIPVNVIFNPEGAKAELDRWNLEIAKRLWSYPCPK